MGGHPDTTKVVDAAKLHARVDSIDRAACVELLDRYGFAVYAHEPVELLRRAIVVNVRDGTIPAADLPG